MPIYKNDESGEKGQSLVEYLIIVALVAVGAIGIMRVVGQSVNVSFARIAKSLGATSSGGRIEAASIRESHYSKKSLRNFMSGSSREKEAEDDDSGS